MFIKPHLNPNIPRGAGSFLGLRSRMFLYFGLSFAVILSALQMIEMFGAPFSTFKGEVLQKRLEVRKNLNLVADLKKESLVRWLKERRDDSQILAESGIIIKSALELQSLILEYKNQGLVKEKSDALLEKEPVYQELYKHLVLVKEVYGVYERIKIVDAKSGEVIVSTRKTGMDVCKEEELPGVVNPVKKYQILECKNPVTGQFSLLISRPITKKGIANGTESGKNFAALVMSVNTDDILKPILHTGEGFGKTGEALLVGRDMEFITSPGRPLKNGERPTHLKFKINPMPPVSQENGGLMEGVDYRGKTVLAAYRDIPVAPDFTWGLVVKWDRAEVFAPLRQSYSFSIFISFLGVFLVLILSIIVSNNLYRPIKALIEAARRVENEDFSQEAPVTGADELNALTATFNGMVRRIGMWRQKLEEEVRNRTAQLSLANKNLEDEIFERESVEKALKRERDRAQQYLNVAGVILLVIDDCQNVALVNQKGCEILGWDEKDIVGKNWFENFLPERNRDEVAKVFRKLVTGNIEPVEYYENPVITRKGEEKTIAWHNSILHGETGKIIGVLSSGEDITERKKAEEALRENESRLRKLSNEFHTLLNSISDTITLLSPEMKVLWSNSGGASGLNREYSNLTGHFCYKLWHNRAAPCKDCIAKKTFLTGKPGSTQMRSKDGKFWEVRAFPIKDETGKVNSVIEIAVDITKKMDFQAETARTKHLASIGELAAGVAHEINNPINGIINYAQILVNKSDGKSREHDIADRILKESDRIAVIVRSLLSFARERKEEKELIDIHEVLSDSLALIKAQLKKEGTKLIVNYPTGLPEIKAHSQQIQQVFLNVINNGRYALNEKFPKGDENNKILEITCEEDAAASPRQAKITFHDNGVGMSTDIIEKAMDPFFSTKAPGKGTGLGLSISHGIICNHGGSISINSVEGEFTRVIIRLPLEKETENYKLETKE